MIYLTETPRGSRIAQEFQAGTTGAFSDIASRKEVVPALRYNNDNPNGRNYIKFDGIEKDKNGTIILLIDAKTNLPFWNKGAMESVKDTLRRINSALEQNPDFKVVYEFPDVKAAVKADKFLQNTEYKNTITIRVRA